MFEVIHQDKMPHICWFWLLSGEDLSLFSVVFGLRAGQKRLINKSKFNLIKIISKLY